MVSYRECVKAWCTDRHVHVQVAGDHRCRGSVTSHWICGHEAIDDESGGNVTGPRLEWRCHSTGMSFRCFPSWILSDSHDLGIVVEWKGRITRTCLECGGHTINLSSHFSPSISFSFTCTAFFTCFPLGLVAVDAVYVVVW